MALESVQFKTDEELLDARKLTPYNLYANEDRGDIFTKMPVETQMGFNPEQPLFQPFEHPNLRHAPIETPGFFETGAHAFSENNELFEAARTISSIPEHMNALSDPIPDGWTPYTKDSLKDIDQKYWSYIFDAVSPKEQEARRQFIFTKQQENESYNNGSYLAKFLGGGAGYLMGPSTLLMPISSTIKYARVGQDILLKTLRNAPEFALQSVAHNAFMEGNRVGGNLQDFMVNSIVDATGGLVLTGGAAAFGHVVTGGQLFNARKALNLNYEGMEVKFNVNENGELDKFKPYIASPLPGQNLSAAYVNSAQIFLDSKMAKEGLFKLIPGLTTVAGKLSPVVRMLNSPFSTVNEFANRLFDHSIVTKGLAEGQVQGNNFERIMWAVRSDSKQLGWWLEGLRKEANGIESAGAPDQAGKALEQRMAKGPAFDKEQFGAEVSTVIRTGEQHPNKAINEAAATLKTHLEKTYKSFLNAYGLSEEIFPPRTAIGYLMRNYNLDAVNAKLPEWNQVVSSALKEQDNLIRELKAPIEKAEAYLNQLKEFKLGQTTEDRALVNEIEEARVNLKRERESLLNRLQDDENLHILLEERNFLDSKQRKEMRSLLKPIQDFKLTIQKQSDLVGAGKKEIARLKSLGIKGKKTETKNKHVKTIEKYEEQLLKEEEKLRVLKNELIDRQEELNLRATEGEINQRFFLHNKEENRITFRDPDELPKLRDVYESDEARIQAAEAYRERIMNVTPEQLGQQMLGSLSGGNLENPLKARSLLIPDKVLQDGGFLSNDLSRNVSLYDSILGKKTAFKSIFNQFGTGDGIEGIMEEFARERRIKQLEIEKLPADKQEDARRKLGKEFDKAKADLKNAYDNAMGNFQRFGARKMRVFSKAARDFTVSTRLGAVPLTMVSDIGGVLLNNSIIEVIRDGFLPFARTFNGMIKSKEGLRYRENAAHLFIATEHLGNAYADKAWNSSTMADVSVGGKVANTLDRIAHLSGNLFGTNYLDNFLQRMTANITQSKIMNYMVKFKNGTISDKERLILNRFGINPEQWADRFIQNFKEVGGEEVKGGGYQSAYYLWKDQEASLRMGNAIRSGVRAAVLKKGIGDAPFWTNDPAFGLITHLKGWVFTAFTRYTVPTMQRFDADKALGLGVMLLMGSLVDPLRKWSRGEEYDFSDKTKFSLDAINNSGALGIISDVFQDLNALTHGEFLGKMKNDRYRERTFAGILLGPLGGIADDVFNVFTAFGSGKINQQDFNKFLRLVPLGQPWYLRYLSNKLTESLDLPKNRNHAKGWFEKG